MMRKIKHTNWQHHSAPAKGQQPWRQRKPAHRLPRKMQGIKGSLQLNSNSPIQITNHRMPRQTKKVHVEKIYQPSQISGARLQRVGLEGNRKMQGKASAPLEELLVLVATVNTISWVYRRSNRHATKGRWRSVTLRTRTQANRTGICEMKTKKR